MNTQRAVALSLCLPSCVRCWKKAKLLENIWQEIFEHFSRRQMLFSNAAGECGRCLFHSYFEDIGRPWTQEQGWGVFQLRGRCRCFPGILWSFWWVIKPSALTMKEILLLPKVMPSTSSTLTSLKTILPEEPCPTHIARRPPTALNYAQFLDGIVLDSISCCRKLPGIQCLGFEGLQGILSEWRRKRAWAFRCFLVGEDQRVCRWCWMWGRRQKHGKLWQSNQICMAWF